MNLNNIHGEIFLFILEVLARDMVRKCPRFNRAGGLRFVEVLSEYATLCLVNQRFNEFMCRVRVDGKLLKTTLMDLAITNFGTMLVASDTLDCPQAGRNAEIHVTIGNLRATCGPVWKNPQLWDSLGSIMNFCDTVYDINWNEITPWLLYWTPITFKGRLARNPGVGDRYTIGDYLGMEPGKNNLDFTLGPYQIEIEADLDSEPLGDGDLYLWTGISLTRYECPQKTGDDLGKDMGGHEQAPYWLWYREYRSQDNPDLKEYIYNIVDYPQGKVLSHLWWDTGICFDFRDLTRPK
jgi:hypothetical protein